MFYNKYWIRWIRIYRHILYPFWKHPEHLKPTTIYQFFGDFIYYWLDVLCLPEAFLFMNKLVKRNIRGLTEAEVMMASNFYGDLLNYDKILIDNQSKFLTKKFNFAYVSFNLINYWQSIADYVLIHELVHVHQYRKFGIVYIFRALLAQNSKEVYNYGGFQGLKKAIANKKGLYDFNFEQQASIIEHFYMIKNREDLRYNNELLETYEYFFRQL